jgi:hypothetical protein
MNTRIGARQQERNMAAFTYPQSVAGATVNRLHALYRIDYLAPKAKRGEAPEKAHYVATDQNGKIVLSQINDGKAGISLLFWEQYMRLAQE